MDEKEYAAEDINRNLIEELLGLPPEVVKGIYVFGSHAFGTATPQSDWDFYAVVDGCVGPLAADVARTKDEPLPANESEASPVDIPDRPEELRWEVLYNRGNVDMTVYEAGNWQEMLDYQDLHSVLCQHFLPSSLALKNSPERFSWELDLMRLKHSVNAYVWSHHELGRKFMKRKKHVRGRKCMVHCLRTMLMANSLIENIGRAVDFGVNELANEYFREVMGFDGESMSWQELDRWFHLLYHPLRLKFRQGTNAYRRKMRSIERHVVEKKAKLATIDYIRLSLQEETHNPATQRQEGDIRRNDWSFLKRELSMRVARHHLFPNLVQINQQPHSSPAQCRVVRECCGLVLDEDDDWRVACQGFPRLFHYTEDEEKYLPVISEWDRVRIYEVSPGLSTTLYWHSDRWLVSSTTNSFIGRCLRKRERSRIRREEGREMDEGKDWNKLVETLFWRVWKDCGYRFPVDKDRCYMFRLVTQGANIAHLLATDDSVDKNDERHDKERLVLVGVRDLTTLEESLPERCAHENGWECAVERRDLATLVAQWAQQGEPTAAELKEISRRGGGGGRPSTLSVVAKAKNGGQPATAEADVPASVVDARKRQKYVMDKLVDKCWELNVLEAQGVIVCDPGFNRIVAHSPPHFSLSSLGPYTHRHAKEEYFLTLVRTTFDHKERFCHYYPDWAHWYRYVHALLKSLCDETDRLYIDTLSKMSSKEMGEWFQEQKRLDTKESRRGKLLKLIYQANEARRSKACGKSSPQKDSGADEDHPMVAMKVTTLGHYLALEGVKNVHVSKGLEGFLFSAYNQQLKPTRKRYATRKLPAMPLPALPGCPTCAQLTAGEAEGEKETSE